MGRTGETAHICADFSKDNLRTAPCDSRYLVNGCDSSFIFRHIPFYHLVQNGNPSVQIVNVVDDLGQEPALQWCCDAIYGLHQLIQLWPHPAVDHPGNLIAVRHFVGNDFLQQLA